MSALRSASALLALALAAACAPAPSTAADPGPSPEPRTTVEVTNDSHSDVVVYVARSGMRFRLGNVASMEVKSFVIPPAAIVRSGTIRLVADPIGLTDAYATEPIPVAHGSDVAFRVKKQITNSYYAIRSR